MTDPLRFATDEHLEQEHDAPTLRLDFHFAGNYLRMAKHDGNHLDIVLGFPLKNTNGGPGGMSSELMREIYKAIDRFTRRRNFRIGSKITSQGGLTRGIISAIDYEAGTAVLECGGVVKLKKMTTTEY